MTTQYDKPHEKVVNIHTRKPDNDAIITMLENTLVAARQGHIKNVALTYISEKGKIIKGNAGNAAYNTALMGGLMSLSISLAQTP